MKRDAYTFSQVPTAQIPRSVFNRSHGHKTTFDAGLLVPILVDEALPGDTFKCNASVFARMATPIFPVMDNLQLDVFFFFVPNRLVWDNWQRFCGEQDNPGDSTDFLVPVVQAGEGGFDRGGLFDYFGVPCEVPGIEVSAFWARAYNLIYNEWFRDQNLIDSIAVNKDDGPDLEGDYAVKRRGKRHDYFTSCLPFPQKGPAALVSIGDVAPVLADRTSPFISDVPFVQWQNPPDPVQESTLFVAPGVGNPPVVVGGNNDTASVQMIRWGNQTGLFADLSQAEAATINDLRTAFQIQKLLERDARGGTRYVEILRSHFGVVSPDARLQRPEYLGGGSVTVNINPVTQTSAVGGQPTPQGNLAAYAVAGGKGIGFSKSFVEHGVILGLVCAKADLSYQQGIHRMFSRRTRYDFYWPAFANLGEQAVLGKEIFADGTTDDELVFGYQERWAEYRYFPSRITGLFNSTNAVPLDSWHLAQEFTERPNLNDIFIEENPPIDRVIAVPAQPHFIFDSHFSLQCTRPMPTYSVPGMIDHF